jgi:hypothetical protein
MFRSGITQTFDCSMASWVRFRSASSVESDSHFEEVVVVVPRHLHEQCLRWKHALRRRRPRLMLLIRRLFIRRPGLIVVRRLLLVLEPLLLLGVLLLQLLRLLLVLLLGLQRSRFICLLLC